MRRTYAILIFINVFVFEACCFYLPIVDYNVRGDFSAKPCRIDSDPYFVDNDSLTIKAAVDVLTPCHCRARSLGYFMANIKLQILKNKYNRAILRVKLKENGQVTSTDGKRMIGGEPMLPDKTNVYLIIQDTTYYIMGNNQTNNTLFDFNYSKKDPFNYNDQILQIDLGNISLPDGSSVPL